jgi:hypothetical protein
MCRADQARLGALPLQPYPLEEDSVAQRQPATDGTHIDGIVPVVGLRQDPLPVLPNVVLDTQVVLGGPRGGWEEVVWMGPGRVWGGL